MNATLLAGVLSSSILSGTSLLYGTLGELIGERAGIVNLGLEGIMLIGAAVGIAATALTAIPISDRAAALAGATANLMFAYVVIGRRANQLAAGLSLMFFGFGVSALAGRPFVGALITGLPRLQILGLGDGARAGGIGARLLEYDILVYLACRPRFSCGGCCSAPDGGSDCARSARVRRSPMRRPPAGMAAIPSPGAGRPLRRHRRAHLSVALTLTWARG